MGPTVLSGAVRWFHKEPVCICRAEASIPFITYPRKVHHRSMLAPLFPFGTHKGLPMSEVPREYLEWYLRENELLMKQCRAELERRDTLEEATQSMAERIIQAGYRALAKQLHPDLGGDPAQFRELQGTVEELRSVLRVDVVQPRPAVRQSPSYGRARRAG
jgi:Putative quorum-sensing-regulated virulence factor